MLSGSQNSGKPKEYRSNKDQGDKSHKRKNKRHRTQEDDLGGQTHKHRPHHHRHHKSSVISNSESLYAESTEEPCFRLQTSSLYLPLSPISQFHPLQGLCAEHLSPLILTYHAPLHGVVLSYSNVRLSEEAGGLPYINPKGPILARSVDEYAASFVWITADFLTFSPQRGAWIEGWINLQNESHLGLVCWNLFTATIRRKRLPQDWRWVEGRKDSAAESKKRKYGNARVSDQVEANDDRPSGDSTPYSLGYFEDGKGKKIEGSIRFKVRDIEASPGSDRERCFLSIEGSLLKDQEESLLLEQESSRKHRRHPELTPQRKHLNDLRPGVLINVQPDSIGHLEHTPKPTEGIAS